ncbi:MAG: hypothetical protein ACK5IC_05290 [Moheibacter sp.]
MKKIILLFLISITVISCQITERFVLNESGAVNYETEIDFSEMMGFMSSSKADSLGDFGKFPIDTIIRFSEVEKLDDFKLDSISDADREFLKSMDKTDVRIQMDENIGKMSIMINEKNVTDFNSYLKKMNDSYMKLMKEDSETGDKLSELGLINPLEIQYDGKTFQRKMTNDLKSVISEAGDSVFSEMSQMLNMFTYKLEYHFPKKIKNSSIEEATYSLDGKVMTIEGSLTELKEDPEKYNFTVEFE